MRMITRKRKRVVSIMMRRMKMREKTFRILLIQAKLSVSGMMVVVE